MDEIQNCIQDAQYGMALRGKDHAEPTKLLPTPPPGTDLEAVAKENDLHKPSVVLHSPIGRHFLSKVCSFSGHVTCILLFRTFRVLPLLSLAPRKPQIAPYKSA